MATWLAAAPGPDGGLIHMARMRGPGITQPSAPTIRRPTPPRAPLAPMRMREIAAEKKAQKKKSVRSLLKTGPSGFPLLDNLFAKPGAAAKKPKP